MRVGSSPTSGTIFVADIDRNAAATKGDVLDARIDALETRLQIFESRLLEAMHNVKTEMLKAFSEAEKRLNMPPAA